MSDDHEHEHGPEFPFPFAFFTPQTPEQREREQMEMLSNAHETRHFLESLKEDQLKKLAGVIRSISGSPEAGAYYVGMIGMKLDTKFGICVSCGRKHDEELADLVGDGGSDEAPEQVTKGSVLYNKLMNEYGMEQDDDGSDKVMCKNCKKWYENLPDRMLRPPGVTGCSGCIEKTRWG